MASPVPQPLPTGHWLQGLEVVTALKAHPRLSEAAAVLGSSEAQLLVELGQLETQLRAQLFRIQNGVAEPLLAGVAAGPIAQAMLELRDCLLAELAQLAPPQREIRIGSSTTAGNYVLPVLLRSFERRFPELRVTMHVADTSAVLAAIRAGESELAIVGGVEDDPNLHFEPFIDDEIVLIAPPNHPLVTLPELAVVDLVRYPWVVREGGSATQASLEALLGHQLLGQRVCIGLVLESTEAIKLAVRAGDGIAFVSRRAVDNELQQGKLAARSLPGAGLARKFWLVRRKQRILAYAALELWKYLLVSARDHDLRARAG